jgi:hypothetical protein
MKENRVPRETFRLARDGRLRAMKRPRHLAMSRARHEPRGDERRKLTPLPRAVPLEAGGVTEVIGAVRPWTMRRPEPGRTYGFGGMPRPAHGAI